MQSHFMYEGNLLPVPANVEEVVTMSADSVQIFIDNIRGYFVAHETEQGTAVFVVYGRPRTCTFFAHLYALKVCNKSMFGLVIL